VDVAQQLHLSQGLRINAFPHARAGHAFHSGINAGKLKGVMPRVCR
jgi:hypothetical protein